MFNSLSDRFRDSFKQLRGKGVLTQSDVDNTVSEIRRALLEADVALPVVKQFTAQVKDCLLYTSPSPRDLSTSRMPSSA